VLLALLLLVVLFLGFTQWNWFGTQSNTSSGGSQTISSPMPTANTGGGAAASPSALPSTSP
jgi:drug/metabolite transporter (DMT)-like permease